MFDKSAYHRFIMIFISFLIIWYGGSNRRCRIYQRIVVGSTCRRVAAISILLGVHRDRGTSYGEQQSWSRRRKTRRGCHGEETTTTDDNRGREREKAILWYMLLQGREEKRTGTRNGAGNGLRRLGMKGREAVREKRRDGKGYRDEKRISR